MITHRMRGAFLFVVLLMTATLLPADERQYRFRLTPDPHGFKLADAQGTHWIWILISCPTANPGCEWSLNDRGSAKRDDADFGVALKAERVVRLRCLRSECTVEYCLGEEKPTRKRLSSEETIPIPMDAQVSITFPE